jgi:SAM-dependent methyltransferase
MTIAALGEPSLDTGQTMADDELQYWQGQFHAYKQSGDAYVDRLLNPQTPLDPRLERLIADTLPAAGATARILDVGCGPLSVLGKRASFPIELVGVDPLADDYKALLARAGLEPPHRSVAGMGETLDELFEPESFDFIYSRNALDHCENPMRVISNMMRLARAGAKILILVNQNEAENAAYSGFHRWNFDKLSNFVVVWNGGSARLLDEIIGGRPYSFTIEDHYPGKKFPGELEIVIHKNNTSPDRLERVAPGLAAAYSSKHGWVTLVADGSAPIDENLSVFVHGLNKGTMGFRTSFRWYRDRPVRSVAVPAGEFEQVRLGQFYRDYGGGSQGYVNVWTATLDSPD